MTLTYYFDFLSPYSYLSWTWMRENYEYLKSHGEVILKPVTLAPIIKSNETKGPAEIPAKREYLMRDCLRFAELHNIPFTAPSLPFNSLYALRVSLVEMVGDDQLPLIDCLFRAAWERGQDLGNSDVVLSTLNEAGFNGSELLERVGDKETRKQLKDNTKEAIDREIFGLPSFFVDNGEKAEIFWGNDSIPHLKLALEGRDPLQNSRVQEKLKQFQEAFMELKS